MRLREDECTAREVRDGHRRVWFAARRSDDKEAHHAWTDQSLPSSVYEATSDSGHVTMTDSLAEIG